MELHDSRLNQSLEREKLALEIKYDDLLFRFKNLEHRYSHEVIINNRLTDLLREHGVPLDKSLFKVE